MTTFKSLTAPTAMSTSSATTRIALLAFVALAQFGLLGKIVYDRVALLKSGREIILPIIPIDPRDFFRGDYVILGYPLSQIAVAELPAGSKIAQLDNGDTVYVAIRQAADGAWSPISVASSPPQGLGDGDAVLRGRVTMRELDSSGGLSRIGVAYGIERYFVPEGTGKALEDKVREKSMQAIVAVDADGDAAIKGLVIDGERREDPPLF